MYARYPFYFQEYVLTLIPFPPATRTRVLVPFSLVSRVLVPMSECGRYASASARPSPDAHSCSYHARPCACPSPRVSIRCRLHPVVTRPLPSILIRPRSLFPRPPAVGERSPHPSLSARHGTNTSALESRRVCKLTRSRRLCSLYTSAGVHPTRASAAL